jgi:hypothetical protein
MGESAVRPAISRGTREDRIAKVRLRAANRINKSICLHFAIYPTQWWMALASENTLGVWTELPDNIHKIMYLNWIKDGLASSWIPNPICAVNTEA